LPSDQALTYGIQIAENGEYSRKISFREKTHTPPAGPLQDLIRISRQKLSESHPMVPVSPLPN